MPYKINGTASHDCKIFVIDSTLEEVTNVADVSAGAYEVGAIPAENNHVFAINPINGQLVGHGNVDAIEYTYYPEEFGVQIKEFKTHAPYHPGINVTKQSGGLRIAGAGIGSLTLFTSMPTEVMVGKKLKIDWYCTRSYARDTYVRVFDGAYDRANRSDIPNLSSTGITYPYNIFTLKGAGRLFEYIDNGSWARHTYTSSIIDVSSAQLDDVTLSITLYNVNSGGSFTLDVYNIQIVESDDTVKSSLENNSSTFTYPPGNDGDSWTEAVYGDYDAFNV